MTEWVLKYRNRLKPIMRHLKIYYNLSNNVQNKFYLVSMCLNLSKHVKMALDSLQNVDDLRHSSIYQKLAKIHSQKLSKNGWQISHHTKRNISNDQHQHSRVPRKITEDVFFFVFCHIKISDKHYRQLFLHVFKTRHT